MSLEVNTSETFRLASPVYYPYKLLRFRAGNITFITGFHASDGVSERAEIRAGESNLPGDTYLVINVLTGAVVRNFRLEDKVETVAVDVAA